MSRTIQKNCLQCEKIFDAPQKEHNRGNAKFCSLSCSSRYRQAKKFSEINKPNVLCSNCKKEFYKNKSQKKNSKSGLFFCSRECKDSAQKIGGIKEIQPSHYGTSKSKKAYRKQALYKKENQCNRCGYDKYIEVLQVHHVDRDRDNNNLENLEILCPTCHVEEHFLSKDGYWHKSN